MRRQRLLIPVLVIGLTLAAFGSTRAQPPAGEAIDPRVRAELVEAREAVWRAYFQGDSAALVRLLPERMTAMGRDRADIIRDARRFVSRGGRYQGMEFTQEQFFIDGNVAIVWSRYVAHITDSAGTETRLAGRAIELFVKEGGRWVNPHWHLDDDRAERN